MCCSLEGDRSITGKIGTRGRKEQCERRLSREAYSEERSLPSSHSADAYFVPRTLPVSCVVLGVVVRNSHTIGEYSATGPYPGQHSTLGSGFSPCC